MKRYTSEENGQAGPHRRRPLPVMLLHIDGSKHRWLNDDRYYDLLAILDDATSEIYYAQLVEDVNRFLRERYIEEFNRKFSQPAAENGTAFQRCRRSDLEEIFSGTDPTDGNPR